MKIGSEVYLVAAPHVDDTILKIRMAMPSLTQLANESENKSEYVKSLMENYDE